MSPLSQVTSVYLYHLLKNYNKTIMANIDVRFKISCNSFKLSSSLLFGKAIKVTQFNLQGFGESASTGTQSFPNVLLNKL